MCNLYSVSKGPAGHRRGTRVTVRKANKIFISHSGHDRAFAKLVAECLKQLPHTLAGPRQPDP
jgi:hypothetical protein